MALLVDSAFETPHGISIPSSYWRWVGLGVDVPAGKLAVSLYAYASAGAFAAGKQPVGQRQFEVSGAEFGGLVLSPLEGENLSEAISNVVYAYVVGNDPFFASATSVE